MKNHRCYVCSRIDRESRLVRAVFTRDYCEKWGHRLCFDGCNKYLVKMREPYRWKFNPPNVRDHRAGPSDQGKADQAIVAGSGASTCWADAQSAGKMP